MARSNGSMKPQHSSHVRCVKFLGHVFNEVCVGSGVFVNNRTWRCDACNLVLNLSKGSSPRASQLPYGSRNLRCIDHVVALVMGQ